MNTILIGKRIKELRKENGLSQINLADLCQVKQSCVSKWERGATLPDIEMIITLTKILNTSADYLLGIKDYERITVCQHVKKARLNRAFFRLSFYNFLP